MELKDYIKKLYSYLENEKEYTVLKWHSYGMTHLHAYSINDSQYFKNKQLINHDYKKFYNQKDFFEFIEKNQKSINFKKDDQTIFDCFIELFKKENNQEKIHFLKNIEKWTNNYWKDHFFYIIDSISTNKKELIDNIHSIPVSVLESQIIDIDKLNNFLISKELTDKELDTFYLKFYKSRKNQLKHTSIGPAYRDFLLKRYGRNEEKLKPYFDFFNFIKDEFIQIDLDFNEVISKNTISTRINCRKASQLLCIPNFNEFKIQDEIEKFITGMKEFRKLDQVVIEEYDKLKCIIEIRLYSNYNNNLNQESLNNDIKNFLLFKKNNPDIETNRSTVEKFLMRDELSSTLTNQNENNPKKIKI